MRIRSLKHKQLIALLLIALTPLFALTASMWMQAQNSKEQAVQTYQGYADTIAIALEKELDRQKERLEEAAVAAGLLFSSPDNADIRAFEQILYITSGRYSSSIAVNVSGQLLAYSSALTTDQAESIITNPSEHWFFRQTIRSGRTTLGEAKDSNSGAHVFIGTPVFSRSIYPRIDAVLIAKVDLQKLLETAADAYLPANASITLESSRSELASLGRKPHANAIALSAAMTNFPWKIEITAEQADILTRPNLISLLGTLVVIFVSAISFLFGRAYIKTLKTFFDELSASISILSQGKPLPAAVGNLERVSEAKGLLTQFREMADHVVKSDLALREANANLERRVKQRTADLERRNRELSAINLLLSPIAQSPKDNDAPVFSMALERFGQAWDLDQIVIADGEHHCSSREVRQHYQTVTPLKDEKVLAVRSSYPMNPELQEALERFARFIDIVLDNKRLYIDISKQHAALTAALGGMAEGFVLFDKDAKVIFSNEKFRRFTSDSLQLNLDKSSREIFDFLNHLSPSSAAHESPSSAQNDVLELIDKDAKRRHFHLSRLTVHLCGYDHHVFDGLAVLVRDITNEYEVSRLKDDVIGLVAHELNNPVATIRIGLETLIKRNSHLSPALRLQITENMASDALRLQNLITEWLNISRLNSGVLSCKMERLDVVGLISQQIDEWEKQTEMTVQRLYKFSPLYTMGDAARLRQVLRNLLDNALKYNNKTRPKISVSVKTMNADIIVDVQDNGMGIAAEDLEKIFERFYRSERARQQTQQGSGLGLAICRAIVERFGGTLTIKDTALDIGSTFRVTLPILSEN